MNARAWARHKDTYCHRCRHHSKRKPCPLWQILEADIDDDMANKPFRRLGRCSQFENPPKRKRKDHQTRKAGR